MKISVDVLRRYTALPDSLRQTRLLLDDLGLEVKRLNADGHLTLELLANRGDHHCYEGLAREITGRTGEALTTPPVATLTVGAEPWPLRLETDLCLVYTATLLERVGEAAGQLDEGQLAPLRAAGLASVLAPVDATNLSNLELGQPTHVFDADTLVGAVTIRLSRAGERAWPLFTAEPVAVPEGTLVIADDVKILAIAGVIGCEESKTTASTRRILLESATFDPVKVRIASRALGIHTDSTARFERGSDPARPLIGAGRVVQLLEGTGAWRRVGDTGQVGAWVNPERVVSLSVAAAGRFFGMSLPGEQIVQILGRLGYIAHLSPDDGDTVTAYVPTWRLWDVEYADDLYEDLARSIGYNNTPVALPPVDMGALPSAAELRRHQLDGLLQSFGFYEVFTDGFYGRALIENLGLPEAHPLRAHVQTENALDRAYSLLKVSCFPQAVELVALNQRVKNEQVKAYEWTRTFHPARQHSLPSGRLSAPCTERRVLWCVASGTDRPRAWLDKSRPADLFFMKGVVEELAVALGLDLQLGPAQASAPLADVLHPARQASVLLNGAVIGVVGEVHPSVLKGFKVRKLRPVYLELDEDALLAASSQAVGFEEPSELHPIDRSLAFSLPPKVEAGLVSETLRAAGPPSLTRVKVVDLFEHEEAGVALRTFTFALTFQATKGQALSADEVNAACEAMIAAVEAGEPGARGVRLRR
ncbi:phenylalanine--tRNA ligase subunit beta [Myxococcota bacterium]|nr:phenylalanine--tRNA ligase subunit beta [Myxococcota bacterium]